MDPNTHRHTTFIGHKNKETHTQSLTRQSPTHFLNPNQNISESKTNITFESKWKKGERHTTNDITQWKDVIIIFPSYLCVCFFFFPLFDICGRCVFRSSISGCVYVCVFSSMYFFLIRDCFVFLLLDIIERSDCFCWWVREHSTSHHFLDFLGKLIISWIEDIYTHTQCIWSLFGVVSTVTSISGLQRFFSQNTHVPSHSLTINSHVKRNLMIHTQTLFGQNQWIKLENLRQSSDG